MPNYRPITPERERYVTVWSRWPASGDQPAGRWVGERNHVLWYAEDVLELSLTEATLRGGREYQVFEHRVDANLHRHDDGAPGDPLAHIEGEHPGAPTVQAFPNVAFAVAWHAEQHAWQEGAG